MSKPAQLTLKQLDDMKSFAPVFSYFDECLELIKPSFKEKFSKNKNQMSGYLEGYANRYGLRQFILNSKKSGTIHVYFTWGNISKIEVIFWVEKNNQYWEKMRNLVASNEYIKRDLPAREGLFIAPEEWN